MEEWGKEVVEKGWRGGVGRGGSKNNGLGKEIGGKDGEGGVGRLGSKDGGVG